MTEDVEALEPISLRWQDVFPAAEGPDHAEVYLSLPPSWKGVQFFVGRNGSGKSKTAREVAVKCGGRFVSTDRLTGIMGFTAWSGAHLPGQFRGVPLGAQELQDFQNAARRYGGGEAVLGLHALHDRPDVRLRVMAFLRRALGRSIELRESAGYLDPYVRLNGKEYSLFRDEGHGLRELILLLVEIYRDDWNVLVIDEPELHLHPSMARLWLSELSQECARRGRRAVVVTHEPSLLRPKTSSDLDAIWVFRPGERPARFGDAVRPADRDRADSSLAQNPSLVSLLAFSPRPVLVEGPTDVAALTAALQRLCPPEVVAQTDLVECGGAGNTAMWHGIARRLGLDVRAIADLDALFSPGVHAEMDDNPEVIAAYRETLFVNPPRTHTVIRDLVNAARGAGYDGNPRGRAAWLAATGPDASTEAKKGAKVREIWREAGVWLHPQGTLEDVLGIDGDKGREIARRAAEAGPGDIDAVAHWCAYELDLGGDLALLVRSAVEGIAQGIQRAQGEESEAEFSAPVGGDLSAKEFVDVTSLGDGRYRLTVNTPDEYAGYFLEFDRTTAPAAMSLTPPADDRSSATSGDPT